MRYVILFFLLAGLVSAQEPEPQSEGTPSSVATPTPLPTSKKKVLQVGVAGSRPFVVPVGKDLEGLSVETWRALARELQMEFKLHHVDSVETVLQGVQEGVYDVAVGPISITSERATFVTFTQPYFDSGLGILSSTQPSEAGTRFRVNLQEIALALGTLIVALTVVGVIFWLLERKANSEQFPEDPASGVGNGMWMALVTMTTVGYGDRAPITPAGRIFTGVWMLITTVTLSSFTAWIATSLTISRLEDNAITKASQLADRRVAVVSGTTSEVFGRHFNARLVYADDYLDAIDRLREGHVEAVVYDFPILQYHINQHPDLPVILSETTFALQDYGFALQRNDENLHRYNVGLLRLAESGILREIKNHWLR